MKNITVQYIDTSKYKVTVLSDGWCYNSLSDFTDSYIIKDFRRNYDGRQAIDDITTENGKLLPSFQAKIRAGKIFWIDIYEHGNSIFRLGGEGMQCQFDTSTQAGYIELADYVTENTDFKTRQRYAQEYLKEYTEFFNGEVFAVTIENSTGDIVDSCGGFVGDYAVQQFIVETIPNAQNENVTITGLYDDGQEYDVYFDYDDCKKLTMEG